MHLVASQQRSTGTGHLESGSADIHLDPRPSGAAVIGNIHAQPPQAARCGLTDARLDSCRCLAYELARHDHIPAADDARLFSGNAADVGAEVLLVV